MTKALEDFLESVKDTPFEWGTHDCYQFTSKAVVAQGGKPLPLVPSYTTQRGAIRQIKNYLRETKWLSMKDYLNSAYLKVKDGTLPPDGSICLRDLNEGLFNFRYGVSYNGSVAFVGGTGLVYLPINLNNDNFWVI